MEAAFCTCAARNFCRVDNSGLDQVDVFVGRDIVAFGAFAFLTPCTINAPSWPALSAS